MLLIIKNGTVTVEGANMITKHTKPSPANQQGGIVSQEGPMDVSNVMLVHNGKTTKIGYKVVDGQKKFVLHVQQAKSLTN